MPPSAAPNTGRAAVRGLRNSPCTTSCLISRPTTKKNSAIKASLTQSRRLSLSPKRPTSRATSVSHKDV